MHRKVCEMIDDLGFTRGFRRGVANSKFAPHREYPGCRSSDSTIRSLDYASCTRIFAPPTHEAQLMAQPPKAPVADAVKHLLGDVS